MATRAGGATGRAVLVTGASSGIGRAIALDLARRGMLVFASVRRAEQADELRESAGPTLTSGPAPGLVPLCPLDLARTDHIPAVAAQIEEELARRGLPGLFGVVSNAGGGGIAPIELMDLAAFQGELSARLLGPVALLQALLPSIRGAWGRIIWIATPGLLPIP